MKQKIRTRNNTVSNTGSDTGNNTGSNTGSKRLKVMAIGNIFI